MAAIFKREVKAYYTGMIGYVTAAVSLFFLGLYFANRNLMYASSDFASVLYTTTMILLFLLPAISMRSFAEERRNKTDQLLLTSPVSIPAIVLGKFLAEVVVFAAPLVVAVVMPLILLAFGTVSLVSAYSALFAYILLGAACLSVGTWISALTENQILAYLATFGALLVAYLMNGIQTMFTSGSVLALIVFLVVLLIAAVLVGVACKSLTTGCAVFCVGAFCWPSCLWRGRPGCSRPLTACWRPWLSLSPSTAWWAACSASRPLSIICRSWRCSCS